MRNYAPNSTSNSQAPRNQSLKVKTISCTKTFWTSKLKNNQASCCSVCSPWNYVFILYFLTILAPRVEDDSLNDGIVELSFFECDHKLSIDDSSLAGLSFERYDAILILKFDVFIVSNKSSWFREEIKSSDDSLFSETNVENSSTRFIEVHLAELQNQCIRAFFI